MHALLSRECQINHQAARESRSYLMTATEQGALATTFDAVVPIRYLSILVFPVLPIRIRSNLLSATASKMALAGVLPRSSMVTTLTPFSSKRALALSIALMASE